MLTAAPAFFSTEAFSDFDQAFIPTIAGTALDTEDGVVLAALIASGLARVRLSRRIPVYAALVGVAVVVVALKSRQAGER